MDSFYRASRRGILVTIAACSMLGGLVLVWHLLRPGVINVIPTAQLLILLGLFVLPVVTIGAWALDLKHAKSAPVPRESSGQPVDARSAQHESVSDAASLTHGRGLGREAAGAGRGSETHRHRRAGETATPTR